MDQRSSALTIAALGVVFGDIGTSPLYAFRVALSASGGTDASHVLGVLSLIFWGLFFVVTVKYVGLILRTDNDGEGGILALAAQTVTYISGLERPIPPERIRSVSNLLIVIYSILAKLATRTTDRFALPPARTLEIGIPRKL
jgi:K+ transporter